MEFYEREFFISRIMAGYLRVKLPSGLVVLVNSPNKHINYQAQEVYNEAYKEAKDLGVIDDDDVLSFLIRSKQWTEENTKELNEILPKHIEYWKVELYKNAARKSKHKQIRQYLDACYKELERLSRIRHSYDYLTCHGIATFARWQLILENCTTYEDGTLYDWDEVGISTVLNQYHESFISDKIYRDLARNEPWQTTWTALKKNCPVFTETVTAEQQRLVVWSSMYDSIRESPECPSDIVIEDDDMLDGWFIVQRKQRGQKEHKISDNEKIESADEVFIQVQRDRSISEQRQEIEMMNSEYASQIKRNRLKQLQEKGSINYKQFDDVRQGIELKLNQAGVKTIKNRGRR